MASFATSYIKTSGSTATRSADVASLSTSAFGYNPEQGSFVMNVKWSGNYPDVSAVVHLGDASDRHLVYYNNGGYRYQVKSGNTVQAQMVAVAQNEDDVLVMSYKANSFYFGDGAQVSLDSAGLLPDITITSLDIGGYSGDNQFNGHIKSIKYLPRQLTQSQLEALTA